MELARVLEAKNTRVLWFEFDLIDKAPHPILARLDGLHNRMLRGMKMFGGVFVFG
jgi:hypothetical protein